MALMAQHRPVGKSNRDIDYRCRVCGRRCPRDELVVKRVEFATMGMHYRKLKTRTVAWLCPECLELDPAWNQESRWGAPGLDDVKRKEGNDV